MKTTYFIKTLLLTCCLIPAIMLAENVSVTQLKTEQLSNPMGIDTASPRLGWQLEASNILLTSRPMPEEAPIITARFICAKIIIFDDSVKLCIRFQTK